LESSTSDSPAPTKLIRHQQVADALIPPSAATVAA
jgi:hypothetical protein